ncbi:MAG: helix-turn-helix domain-containing protein [Candidatus Dojkabacteria bacterium]|jgi:hypothetical protein
MISSYKNIFIISSDKQFITSIKKNIYPDTFKDSSNTKIALIDGRDNLKKSISYINTVDECRKIYIVDDIQHENINKLLDSNENYIISHPVNSKFLNSIINHFQTTQDSIEYHGIKLHIKEHVLEYKSCKVDITKVEFLILKTLIKEEGFCSIKKLRESLGKNMTNNYLQVTVCRINIKSRQVFGIKIIKSKHGVGYRIAI